MEFVQTFLKSRGRRCGKDGKVLENAGKIIRIGIENSARNRNFKIKSELVSVNEYEIRNTPLAPNERRGY